VAQEPFHLIAAVLGVAALVGVLALRLRQPLIVAFIAVGILVGPSGLGWVTDASPLELLAEVGIAVLLFLVGLKLDLHLIRATGPVAVVTGLGQVLFTSGVGFLIAVALGLDTTSAFYVAVALTFSSTIIVVKLLSDKRELEQLHGRVALGFLIVQDIVVVLVMIGLSTTSGDTGNGLWVDIGLTVAKGTALAVLVGVAMRWVLPWLLHRVARSQEVLLVFAVAWAVAMAALGDWLGFSKEVGAFVAGFALASTPFRDAIGSSLTPLRDFLLLFFFIELGATMDLAQVGSEVPRAVVLSLFVLIGNPLIVLVIMGVMGYRKRVGFLAGLTVAQISEFSLIFVALGASLGHIDNTTVGLVTLVGLITIGLSTYLILYSHPIYDRLAPLLRIFERRNPTKGDDIEASEEADVILYGYGRYGRNLVPELIRSDLRVMVVDWDPQSVAEDSGHERLDVVFGDADDPEFPGSLPLASARAVVSTVPDAPTNVALAAALRRWGFDGLVAVTAHTEADLDRMESPDIDLVLHPFIDAATVAGAELLERLPAPDIAQQG
jgi:Kef-type K+ transport system membrane component KefB